MRSTPFVVRRDTESGIEAIRAHFEGHAEAAHRKAGERQLGCAAYVSAMFGTGHDAANRAVFAAEDPRSLDLVGLAVWGPKKDIDKTVKGLKLHD
jgi:hypothetical protein